MCMLLGFRPLPPAPLSRQAGEAPLRPSQQVSHWHALGLPASAAGPPQQSGRRSAVTAFTETEYWHGSGPAKRVRHFATERGRSKRVFTTRIRTPLNYVHVLGLPPLPPAPLSRQARDALSYWLACGCAKQVLYRAPQFGLRPLPPTP